MKIVRNINWSVWVGVPFGLLYGIIARLFFGWDSQMVFDDAFGTMSVAFLFLVPLAIGALTVWFTAGDKRLSWTNAILMPLASVGIGAVAAGLLAYEALICIVMALPVLLAMGVIGGAITCAVLRWRSKRASDTLVGALLLLPYLFAPIEAQFAQRAAFATVETEIAINADAATVWQQIIQVETIEDSERSFSPVFDWIGAPQPQAATLDREGIGGVRTGHFAHGLRFTETIRDWQPNERIEWAIQADTSAVDLAPWGEIGGKFFDVTAASYWIESVSEGHVILHLSSTHRLTTNFNAYGLLWTRWGLGEFQQQVLQIVKARAERNTL